MPLPFPVAGWGLQTWGITEWAGATAPGTGTLIKPGFNARWGFGCRWAMARWAYPIMPGNFGSVRDTPDMTGGFRSGAMSGGFHG
jgi:hypothetical protein